MRIGTWNVSWWTGSRLTPLASLGAQLVAVQETKLSCMQVETVRSSLRRGGYSLHHGHPVPVHREGGHGDSGGVGVIASPGVAVSPLLPQGPAWRRLHAMTRLHGVQIPPRPGLPLGLRVFSVYSALRKDPTHDAFVSAFLDFVASLDMQLPSLFLGDFNGTVDPARDYSAGAAAVCPLLTRLLGPGGPLLDLQLAISPKEYAHTFHMSRSGALHSSRCDLALGNRAVLPLVNGVRVASGILEGGHSPVVVSLRDQPAWAVDWCRPLPQLPFCVNLLGCCEMTRNGWSW